MGFSICLIGEHDARAMSEIFGEWQFSWNFSIILEKSISILLCYLVSHKRKAVLTGPVRRLQLQWHYLELLLICLDVQTGEILLHLPCHLGILIQLLSIKQRAASCPFFMSTALNIQHVWVGAALTQWPVRRWEIRIRGCKDENYVCMAGWRLKECCSVNATACWCKWVKRWRALMQSNMAHMAMF